MAGQNVSKALMLDLLGRLANDDAFRDRFERKPSAALEEVGIPPDQIKGFPEDHTRPGRLVPKTEFETARKRLLSQSGDECLCMIVPGMRLDIGERR